MGLLKRWFANRRRRWVTILGLIAVWMGWSSFQARFHVVETTPAATGSLVLSILTSGEVDGDSGDLGFETGGTLTELYVREGDAVSEGQLLGRIQVSVEMGRLGGPLDTLTAPYDGFVVKIDRRVGTVVQAGFPVLRVVRRGGVWVTAYLDAEDAAYVSPGDRFTCRAGGYLARPWDLEVETIGREALPRDDLPGSANQVRLRLRPLQSEFALPVGAEVDVDGEVPIARDKLIIPAAAVFREEGRSYVWRAVDGKALKTEVRTGQNNFRELVITSGLSPGDEVVVQGKEGLEDGSWLRATPWKVGAE